MYDLVPTAPTTATDPKDKKKQVLDSRINSLRYAAEDYDRVKGKGAFKKDNKPASDLLDALMKHKVACVANDAAEELAEMGGHDDQNGEQHGQY